MSTLVETRSAHLVDNPDLPSEGLDKLEQSLSEAVSERGTQSQDSGTQQTPANQQQNADGSAVQRPDWIPEKFWTGDVNESAQKMGESYSSLQSAYGRMANDLGTQRKLTDKLLASDKRANDLGEPAQRTAPKVNPRDLVDNPTETLDAYWQKREAQLREDWNREQAETRVESAQAAFRARHPDYEQTANDPEFVAWVTASPTRTRAAQNAAAGELEYADELITEFKTLKSPAPAQQVADAGNQNGSQDPHLEAARQVTTESAANAGSSGKSGRVFRRADLMKLKIEKPEVYGDPDFQAEIMAAYDDGRVK